MTATNLLAGAFTDKTRTSWKNINWIKHKGLVFRLQKRIVKAVKQGRWNKVKVLQNLLVNSLSAKLLAVKRVTENRGKRTAGVDGVLWTTSRQKINAIKQLRKQGYHPQPLRRIYIPKNNNPQKKRPLSIPTMRDRAVQALYLLVLEPVAETLADHHSYGFRSCRSTADAMQQCFRALARGGCSEWILEGDIKSCFDEISHPWLEKNIPMDKSILRKWLTAGFVENGEFNSTSEGTPQGGVASAVMCNMTLDGLEKVLIEEFGQKWSIPAKKNKVHLVRYADDFIITGSSKELLQEQIMPVVENFLAQRGLTLSKEKTNIVNVRQGFDFLGQNVRKYSNGKLLIKPSKKSVQSLLKKVRLTIKTLRAATPQIVIGKLNPILRGWANYHKHVVSKAIFQKIDSLIFESVWRWSRRRHPHKPTAWGKRKYFTRTNNTDWIFCSHPKGEKYRIIFKLGWIPIRRHVQIQSHRNPYDFLDSDYFEKRSNKKNFSWQLDFP